MRWTFVVSFWFRITLTTFDTRITTIHLYLPKLYPKHYWFHFFRTRCSSRCYRNCLFNIINWNVKQGFDSSGVPQLRLFWSIFGQMLFVTHHPITDRCQQGENSLHILKHLGHDCFCLNGAEITIRPLQQLKCYNFGTKRTYTSKCRTQPFHTSTSSLFLPISTLCGKFVICCTYTQLVIESVYHM